MNHPIGQIIILGAGIGGLSSAYELLKKGRQVIIIEKDGEAGGLMRAIKHGEYNVDLGHKQFYSRIPRVHSFYMEILGDKLITYKNRIGIYYNNRIIERERKYKGLFRGMSVSLISLGIIDIVAQKIKYIWRRKRTIEDVANSKNGRLFSLIFSQGFDEKLKCRPWSSVPRNKRTETSSFTKYFSLLGFAKEDNNGKNLQENWVHPLKGSGGLIEALRDKIINMGGEIRFNTKVLKLVRQGDRIKSIEIDTDGKISSLETPTIISSIKLDIIAKLLSLKYRIGDEEWSFNRGVIIIYLFFNEPSKFPHTSLYVPDPKQKIGRITNYDVYDCQMVPKGKSCLAFEIFCKKENILLELDDEELMTIVKEEFGESHLIDLKKLESYQVYKLPSCDHATNWEEYKIEKTRNQMYSDLKKIENLYNVSRTGIDKIIYSSIKAAESIITNEKDDFFKETSPVELEPWSM